MSAREYKQAIEHEEVELPAEGEIIKGDLYLPEAAQGVVLFAHGSGSGRFSPRNRQVAWTINDAGMGSFLFDLLSEQEEAIDALTGEFRFNIDLLTDRLLAATNWLISSKQGCSRSIGYFGASTGAAAALAAAARKPDAIRAVVSRGGRPDMAGPELPRVKAPVLLIVGGDDPEVLELNKQAYQSIRAPKELAIIPGATHLFEEEGALESVAQKATEWFTRFLIQE